jgi:hypothetical protein
MHAARHATPATPTAKRNHGAPSSATHVVSHAACQVTIYTTTSSALNETTGDVIQTGGGEMTWDAFFSYQQNRSASKLNYDLYYDPPDWAYFTTPPPSDAWLVLFAATFVYWLVAWYLSQVLTGTDSRPQPLLFFVLPSYWLGASTGKGGGVSSLTARLKKRTLEPELDDDVAAEITAVCGLGEPTSSEAPVRTVGSATVQLLDLRKTFSSISLRPAALANGQLRKRFEAVRGVCLSMHHSQCFALLGHNGAGKTYATR